MKLKKVLSIILSSAIAISAIGCGSESASSSASTSSSGLKVIKVGATPVPHKEILEHIIPTLKEKGYDLQIVEFDDYKLPNEALNSKELDANFFQHIPYLESETKNNGYKLTYTAKVHIEPLGFYSKKITDIKDLADGSQIAVPNDATNEARALQLLANNNIIKIKDGDLVTVEDITENPKNLKFTEVEAAQLPRVLQDVDGAVINTNYALQAGLNPTKDALIIEGSESPYVNVLAVREDNKDSEAIKVLTEALTSKDVKDFINEKYKGSIVPVF